MRTVQISRLLFAMIGPVFCFLAPRSAPAAVIPPDVKTHVQERVEAGLCAGLIVGLVNADGTAYFAHGQRSRDGGTIDENTMFEIGSITKVFTATLLAMALEKGTVKPEDSLAQYLPPGVKAPARGDRAMTLTDLASHHSGLPRLPDNLRPADPKNPYADYTAERLHEFLNSHSLRRDVGAAYEYSNVGGGLLGYALGLAAKKPFDRLVVEQVCKPLGMADTTISLSAQQTARLAKGHEGTQEVKNWDFDVLAGAGALRSTAKDMLTFLSAQLGLKSEEFLPVFRRCYKERWDTGLPDTQVGLGWHITKALGTEIIWHNGGTGGYHSFCGFVPDKKIGVVVLANSNEDIDKIGFHVLEPKVPLTLVRKAIKIDGKLLDSYVGRYALAPFAIFDITRQGEQLFAQLTGQDSLPVFPESTKKFYYKVVDAQLTFVTGDDGKVSELILHQGGIDQRAKRLP